jgi:hypothetical protein
VHPLDEAGHPTDKSIERRTKGRVGTRGEVIEHSSAGTTAKTPPNDNGDAPEDSSLCFKALGRPIENIAGGWDVLEMVLAGRTCIR